MQVFLFGALSSALLMALAGLMFLPADDFLRHQWLAGLMLGSIAGLFLLAWHASCQPILPEDDGPSEDTPS